MQRLMFSNRAIMLSMLGFLYVLNGNSQVRSILPPSQSAVKVIVKQDLQIGAFAQGSAGGTIQLMPDGSRHSSGTVIPLNFGAAYMPLILEIEGPKGSVISILEESTVLTGSNGGSMKLKLRNSQPAMPFIIMEDAPAKSIVTIGAELTAGNMVQSPPGNYSGNLAISFVVE